MAVSKNTQQISPEILSQARQYIELGVDYYMQNDKAHEMLHFALYWTYLNALIRIDMVDLIYTAHANYIKSLRFSKDKVFSQFDNIPHVTIEEFFNCMHNIDDISQRDVIDDMDGLSLNTKELLFNAVKNNDYKSFHDTISANNYDFSVSSKHAYAISLLKNKITSSASAIDTAMQCGSFYSDYIEYLENKFPDIMRLNQLPFNELTDDELKVVGSFQKWYAGFYKANLDQYLLNLPEIKQKIVISKIPIKTYEAYGLIEYPDDVDIVLNLVTNGDLSTFTYQMGQYIDNANEKVSESTTTTLNNISINKEALKNVFKKVYWDGLDDNPNANIDTLAMYIKDLKSDPKTKAIDYARVAYIIHGCEYFIEENPENGRAWTFSAWYKQFCEICNVTYNDNYKDYNNIIPEKPKYQKFIRILPKKR